MPESRPRVPLQLVFAIVIALPGAYLGAASYLGLPHPELAPPLAAAVYGIAIIGAAFILSWAAEAAQVDISAGLALALLALLAVLPEYAVDFVFGFRAGQVFEENGACVPVGVGWPLVVLVATLAVRHAKRSGGHDSVSTHTGAVTMPRAMSAEVVFLGIATIYSLTLPLRSSLTLVDAAVLVAIFAAYALRLAKAPAEEPDLQGAADWIACRPKPGRRWLVSGLFVIAGLVILTTAEHFAEGLVATGSELGVDQFVLVQWVAPLASESPELIVACLYAWRLKAGNSLGTLLSSKVNQWTLLVGTLPIVFAVSSTSLHGLPLDTHQRFELLLTASQSLFAVSLLVTLGLSLRGAVALLVLFLVQFVTSITLPSETDRIVVVAMSGVYLVLAVAQFIRHRRLLVRTTKDGLVTRFGELEKADEEAEARR
jgi:cation:H+ antiporter